MDIQKNATLPFQYVSDECRVKVTLSIFLLCVCVGTVVLQEHKTLLMLAHSHSTAYVVQTRRWQTGT